MHRPATLALRITRALSGLGAVIALLGACEPTPLRSRDSGLDGRMALDTPGPLPDTAPSFDGPIDTLVGSAPLTVVARDVPVTPVGSVRVLDVTFHAGISAYVVAYTWVEAGPVFRTEARTIRVDLAGVPIASGATTIDPLVSPPHNSADPAIAFPPASSSAAGLVVFSDDRLGAGSGQLDVYGQRVRVASADAAPTLEGAPFRVSNVDGTGEVLPGLAWIGTRYFVAWADDRERGIRHEDARVVYGRAVFPDGTLGPELRLGDDTLFQTYPQVSACGSQVLVAWADYVDGGSGVLITQYRGRIFDAASLTMTGAPLLIASVPAVPPDPPALACDERTGDWRVSWTTSGPPNIRQIGTATLTSEGAVTDVRTTTDRTDGALAPRLAWLAPAGEWALSFHAQDTYFGYVSELGDDGRPRSPTATLTETSPRIGTFWTSIAASRVPREVLVVSTLDYDRITATVLAVP